MNKKMEVISSSDSGTGSFGRISFFGVRLDVHLYDLVMELHTAIIKTRTLSPTKNLYKGFVIAFYLSLIAGCAGSPKFTVNTDANQLKRQLAVYRDSSYLGTARTIGLTLNGEGFELKPGAERTLTPKIGRNVLVKSWTSCCTEGATKDPTYSAISFDVPEEGLIKIGVGVRSEFTFERLNINGGFISNQPILAIPPVVNRNGETEITFTDGSRYVGGWKDGKSNGLGKLIWLNGIQYEGEFKDGKQDGMGLTTWVSGSRYKGEYKNGKRNGLGVFTFINGQPAQEGFWSDDKFIRAEKITTQQALDNARYYSDENKKKTSIQVAPTMTIPNRESEQRKKCLRMGLALNSDDFHLCINSYER